MFIFAKKHLLFIKYLFIIAVLFYSCENKDNPERLSFSVSTDYEFTGIVPNENKTYFGFVKKQFNPNIKLFNQDGVLIDSISLKEAEKKLSTITDVWINSVDSICVYSNYNGTLVILNTQGVPIFEKSYYSLVDTKGYNYDLLPSHPLYPSIKNKKHDVNFSTWMWSGSSNKLPKERLDEVRNGFLFCKINPYIADKDDKNTDYKFFFQFSEIKEFSSISDKSLFFAPFYKAFIINEKIVITSFYSRYIYLLSKDLTVQRAFKFIDNTHSIVKPISMKKKGSIQDKADETMKDCLNATFIANILYDSIKENYIFIIKKGPMRANDWDHFPFSIEIYNRNFKKIKEINGSDSSDYLPRKSFILSGKLYIENENNSTPNKKIYEAFKI